MLTLLCSPKPFRDESAWNQLNALRSWRAIGPDVEIFIFGAAVGAAEAAAEVNAVLVPEIESSPSGAPSFGAMAAYASQHGRHDLIVYGNCDILLNGTLLQAMHTTRQRFDRFLLVGERLDLAPGARLDVRQAEWLAGLPKMAASQQLSAHGPTGADYFGFVRGMWSDLPPVFMGRAMCDQALLHYCLRRHIPVVDGTLTVVNVHQYHGYQHVTGGRLEVFRGNDRETMAKAHGLHYSLPTIADADWRIEQSGKVLPDRWRRRRLHRLEFQFRYRYHAKIIAMVLRGLQYVSGKQSVRAPQWPIDLILTGWRH